MMCKDELTRVHASPQQIKSAKHALKTIQIVDKEKSDLFK